LKKILDRDKNRDPKSNFSKTLFFFDFSTLKYKIKINLLGTKSLQKLAAKLLNRWENSSLKNLLKQPPNPF